MTPTRIALAALTLAFAGSAFATGTDVLERIRERQRIVVGSEMKFPTMNVKDPASGRNEGFMADLARAVAKRVLGDERKLEWVQVDDEHRVPDVASAKLDMVFDTTGASAEKAKVVDFSDEIFRSGSGLLVKRGSPIKSLADIAKGTRVIYVKANPDIEHIKAKAPAATYLEFDNSKEAFAALKAGRGDVFTQVVTHLYRAAMADPDYVLVHRFTAKPYAILVPKGNAPLITALNAALHDIRASGEYDRLYAKWFEPYGGSAVR
ncbi:substrate-binding periplasmic protein [Piscinibacter sp.]|jgi:putative glutamine transport system substrate-binding protein|uniref:substrate-binding periplasmic protein n=1 Tax=Piscinibacter sp. TaxID=1903157 RepID=UPI002F3EC941